MNRRFICSLRAEITAAMALLALPLMGRPQAASASLPDVGGFHVGGTMTQLSAQLTAYDKLARIYPAKMVDPYFGNNPLPYAFLFAQGLNATEVIRGDLTSPPDQQIVWRITRTLSFPEGKQPQVNDVLAALRQKYGPESIDMRTNPVRPYWFYNQSGQPAKDGSGVSFQNCFNAPPIAGAWNNDVFDGGGTLDMTLPPDPLQGLLPGCGTMVTLSAVITTGASNSAVASLTVYLADYPLAAREYQKTKALVNGAH